MIVPATEAHLLDVLADLREHEQKAVAVMGDTFMLEEFRKHVVAFAAVIKGKALVVWWVTADNLLAPTGTVWLLATETATKYSIHFALISKREIARLFEHFDVLQGWVAVDFLESQRWLEWLGFQIVPVDAEVSFFRQRKP